MVSHKKGKQVHSEQDFQYLWWEPEDLMARYKFPVNLNYWKQIIHHKLTVQEPGTLLPTETKKRITV